MEIASATAGEQVRVLIAEDSAVTRELLSALLDTDPELEVVGLARDGDEAVALTERFRPDVILMDVHMPHLDGCDASRLIMERVPTPIVMMTASSAVQADSGAFEALRAGALLVVEKPGVSSGPGRDEIADTLVRTLKLMAEVKVVRRRPRRASGGIDGGVTDHLRVERRRSVRVVAIGSSTGGPPVIQEILAALPADLGCPVLVVQHIASGFHDGLAEWLARSTPLRVEVAEHATLARPGAVYLAPGGAQMGIGRDGVLRLTQEPERDGFRPSASYLLESVAHAYGLSALGVVLTGMGRDGASGLRRLREAGGVTVAQDEQSCVVFGMPKEAIRLDAAGLVLSPTGIAELIRASASRQPA